MTAIAPSDGVRVVVGNHGRPSWTTISSPSGSPSGFNLECQLVSVMIEVLSAVVVDVEELIVSRK